MQNVRHPWTKRTFCQWIGFASTPIKPVVEAITSRKSFNNSIVPTAVSQYNHTMPLQDGC